jgi:2,3-diaminopropionate biosynthesis protein SbnA
MANFVNLRKIFGKNIFLKLEGLNIAGSIKLKTATGIIDHLEKSGKIQQGSSIVESSSGNMGIALSIVCKQRGYNFTCVTDPNASPVAEDTMRSYGARIIKVFNKDQQGGYLTTRINCIQNMLCEDTNLVWTNQYASFANIDAHYRTTAPEIYEEFKNPDYLFVGAGTTGTLGGCAKFFKEFSPTTKVIAVDNLGSVTFGGKSAPRFIPGIGTSRRPEIASLENVHEVLIEPEADAVVMCNFLSRKWSLFLGGSSGAVLSAAQKFLQDKPAHCTAVAISPDFGDKYKSTIYSREWVAEKYGTTIADSAFKDI